MGKRRGMCEASGMMMKMRRTCNVEKIRMMLGDKTCGKEKRLEK